MGCASCFSPGDAIIVENGRFFARGVVIGPADKPTPPYPEPRLKVEIFRNKIDVELRLMRLAMSAERPWADAPREMLEQQLARMATQLAGLQGAADQIAALQAEVEGLGEVIAMQCDTLGDVSTDLAAASAEVTNLSRTLLDKGDTTADKEAEDTEWYERLVDHLETYLVRQGLGRKPLRIDDADLRALAQHIRE